ncbi:four-carbon acid sugar kinase family protein [Burkholderia sp. SR8]|uniref:3-oxo-tetronate kinase n=1 Tax=Burkholderia sp. SR8 TaxID=3062277 RepID=UPI0040643099
MRSRPLLGCIADDFTGGTDLASTLVRGGMRTVQTIGVPSHGEVPDADAIVIALKTRTAEPRDAVRQSRAALDWLQRAGCEQFFFKYCSTFDSTPAGNIGPVADALCDSLGIGFAVACPAFPENGRTLYRGCLFVGDGLLHESGMRDHPLTPMTDSNLVRVLQAQTRRPVGAIGLATVEQGAVAIRSACDRLGREGIRYAIVDAVTDRNLSTIGAAVAGHRLVTGGSGVAAGLPANFRAAGKLGNTVAQTSALPAIAGNAVVLSGSCSSATQAQVERWQAARLAFRLDVLELADSDRLIEDAIEWASARVSDGPVLIYGSASPDAVRKAQEALGADMASSLMERALATIAACLVAHAGVRKLVVAGGETSGAIVQALDLSILHIGAPIAPGVPWAVGIGRNGIQLALALKSGNFGTIDFFEQALALAP